MSVPNSGRQSTGNKLVGWSLVLISLCSAVVVLFGAWVASVLAKAMMGVAVGGAWMMLALAFCYVTVRFHTRVGVAMLIGFGIAAVAVVSVAGMHMLS